ncbi:MAG: hypothetical protein PHD21_02220 [Flavobacteriales bacterium]|nr:hypothetical protein [Flavobacteriales bacterium]
MMLSGAAGIYAYVGDRIIIKEIENITNEEQTSPVENDYPCTVYVYDVYQTNQIDGTPKHIYTTYEVTNLPDNVRFLDSREGTRRECP